MSKFSAKLKYLVETSNTNVYQLAKNAGLDRTTIQRSITGERLPGLAFIERLCDYLRISPIERKDLMELYSISKIGEDTYAGRTYVKDLIEQIATLHMLSSSNANSQKSICVSADIEQEIKVISGQYNVNNILRDVLEDEVLNEKSPRISLTIPFSYTYLFDFLLQLYWESQDRVVIEHIVRLSKNPHSDQNTNVNLEMLSHVLPFAFCLGCGYQPHYYYATENIAYDTALSMPFYLYTSKRLITISADYKTAILFNNIDIKNTYHNEFNKSLKQTVPFVRQLSSCADMLSVHLESLSEFGQITNVIEPQPCFAKYYTHKIIDEHLRPDVQDRETVKQALYDLYDRYEEITSQLNSFFSVDGLKYLVATGIIADLPPCYALPFTVEERKHLLESLREDVNNDCFVVRCIDSSKFSVSSLASIQICKRKGLMLISSDGNSNIMSCYIDEQSICDAFRDFFQSLSNSDLVFGKAETLTIIDEALEQLNTM